LGFETVDDLHELLDDPSLLDNIKRHLVLAEFDRFVLECSQVFGEAEDWIDCDAVSTESAFTLPSMDRESSLDLINTPTVGPTVEDVAAVDNDTAAPQDHEDIDLIQSRRLQEAEDTLRSLQQQKTDQRIQEMEEEIRRIQMADTSSGSSGETSNSNQRTTAECKQQRELDAMKRLEATRAKKKRIDGMIPLLQYQLRQLSRIIIIINIMLLFSDGAEDEGRCVVGSSNHAGLHWINVCLSRER